MSGSDDNTEVEATGSPYARVNSDQPVPVHTRHWRAPLGSGYQPGGTVLGGVRLTAPAFHRNKWELLAFPVDPSWAKLPGLVAAVLTI
jgi:hypothetical protein